MSKETPEAGAADAQPVEKTEEQVWAEETARRYGGGDPDETASEAPSETDDADADPGAQEPSEGDKPDDSSEAKEGATEQTQDKQPAVKSTQQPLSPEEKEKRYRGTISSQQRRIRELEDELASFADKSPRARSSKPQNLDELAKEYPELAGPLIAELQELRSGYQTLSQQVRTTAQLQAARREEFYEREEATLADAMPDWQDFVSQHRNGFYEWAEAGGVSPAEFRAIQRNVERIEDGKFVADVLARYRRHLEGDADESRAQAQTQRPTSSARMRGAQSPAPKGSQTSEATARPEDMDGKKAWDALASRRAKTWGAL